MTETFDLGLLLFKIAQYALVLFIGYLVYSGLIFTFLSHKKYKTERIQKEIDYYNKLIELQDIKQQYKYIVKHPIKDEIETPPINGDEDEPEEVDIRSLSDYLAEDPDFLSHNEELNKNVTHMHLIQSSDSKEEDPLIFKKLSNFFRHLGGK